MSTPPGGEWNRRLNQFGGRADHGAHRLREFWERVTEGFEVQQLWAQIHADARSSYQFYAKDIDQTRAEGVSKLKHGLRIAKALFWAMLMKLTPARRVLLLLALVMLFFPSADFRIRQNGRNSAVVVDSTPIHMLGGLLLFGLLALELADRVTMKRDLEIARDIQAWLMPQNAPRVPGVDIAFATRAANTVAGDYYDAFLRPSADGAGAGAAAPDHRLLMAIADVAGKSVPAALLMATFQASLRTLAMSPSSLPELAHGLNEYACGQNIGGTRFTTAFLAELNPAARALTYVLAGHNPPILRRASGEIEHLTIGSLPLGIRPGTVYEAGHTTFGPGDMLVMFTDGLVEAENGQAEEYGEARMLETIQAASSSASAAERLKSLMASVDAFVGAAHQHDDITCMIVRAL